MIWIFYHSADLDGHCSGAIVYDYMFKNHKDKGIKLIPIDYGIDFDIDIINKDDIVYMVDFTLQDSKEDGTNRYHKTIEIHKKCSLYVIDHHKSNAKELKQAGIKGIYGENTKAACELTWGWFYKNKEVPRFVKLLSDYDNWNNEDKTYWEEDVLPFQMGMRMKLTDPNILDAKRLWNMLFNIYNMFELSDFLSKTTTEGKLIIEYENKINADNIKENSFEIEFDGLKFIVCNGGRGSNLFDSIWDKNKYDAMMTFRCCKNKYWAVSMYTTKDIDLSKIAVKYGGGGHAGACGFQIKNINNTKIK